MINIIKIPIFVKFSTAVYMEEFILAPDGSKIYTYEFIESLREENLNLEGGENMVNHIPQQGFQEKVLTCMADVAIVGGKRGGGKTHCMNMIPLYGIQKQGYSCHGFRKEENDVKNGLWKDANELYRGLGEFSESNYTIRFPQFESRISYTHLQNEKEIDRRFRGVEMPNVIIDELPQMSFKTFFTLLASNRNSLGIQNKFVASCNPVGKKHWLYQLLKWYINEDTNEVIHERSGVLRYFFKHGDKITDIIWGDSKQEVYNKARGFIDAIHDTALNDMSSPLDLIASFTFIEGEYGENKIFRKRDKSYLGRLAQQGGKQSVRDIKGIWGDSDSGEELLTVNQFDSMFDCQRSSTKGFRCATGDVALSKDYFVLYAFDDKHVVDWEAFTGIVSKTAVALVEKFLDKNNIREENFAFDSNGLGLFLEGYFPKAKKFNNKEQASNTKLWNNQKSECAEKFVEAVKDSQYSFSPELLERSVGGLTLRERLESQRAALQRKAVDNGRFEIISKAQMKEECHHSPDDLEALFMREVFNGKNRSFRNLGML